MRSNLFGRRGPLPGLGQNQHAIVGTISRPLLHVVVPAEVDIPRDHQYHGESEWAILGSNGDVFRVSKNVSQIGFAHLFQVKLLKNRALSGVGD